MKNLYDFGLFLEKKSEKEEEEKEEEEKEKVIF